MTAAAVPATHREVRLAARPGPGCPLAEEHFAVVGAPVPRPGPGQVLVRNRTMSVTAVMRTLMGGGDLPMPGYEPGTALWGQAIGEVVAVGAPAGPPEVAGPGSVRRGARQPAGERGTSGSGEAPRARAVAASGAPGAVLLPGDLVDHRLGWREYAVLDAALARRLDPSALPEPAAYLSQGASAWMGVVRGAEVQPGDTVLVTGAAGGVGSMAGQIARLRGARRVIGSTGSRWKADHLVDRLGYDAVVLRGAGPIEEQLRAAAPDGVDAVLDTVGGEQLLAALAVARRGARIALVGALSRQSAGVPTAPVRIDTLALTARSVTLRGVTLHDHQDVFPEWIAEFGRGLRAGTLCFPHVRLSGIDQAPRALCELLRGEHLGSVLVDL